MLRLAADENFNNDIVRGVLLWNATTDVVRIQDAGLSRADAPTVLEWAAQTGRVLLTHDVATTTRYAYERVRDSKPMPGVFEVGEVRSAGAANARKNSDDRAKGGQFFQTFLERVYTNLSPSSLGPRALRHNCYWPSVQQKTAKGR